MIAWILGAIGSALLWIFWEIVGDAIGEAVWWLTGPVRRPVWRAFVRARWPWPLLLMVFGGGVASIVGLRVAHLHEGAWQGVAGVGLFLAGAFFAVAGGYFWRDAQRERAALEVREARARSAPRPAS